MQTRGGTWTERFQRLRDHLAQMVSFAVNTGSRDGDERLVMLSRIAMSVVEAMRGRHVTHVSCYQGKPLLRRRSRS